MSLICVGVADDIKENGEITFYKQALETIAKRYKRSVKFSIDWAEPLLSHIQKDSLVISIGDHPGSENCEFLLLPDGWYVNGLTNGMAFRDRMSFLQDVSGVFTDRGRRFELYLGVSGTEPEDYVDILVKNNDLADYLAKTIGVEGINYSGVHISVIP